MCLFSTKFFCRYSTLEFEHKTRSSSSKLILGRTEKTQVFFFARHQRQSAQEVATMRRRKGCNVFNALIRRETNCRRTNDHDLLLSYAEDTSVVSCNRTEVGFFSLVMSFYRLARCVLGIWLLLLFSCRSSSFC